MQSASAAADNRTPDMMAAVSNGSRALLTGERDGLQAMGFDVGSSNPRLEDGDLR